MASRRRPWAGRDRMITLFALLLLGAAGPATAASRFDGQGLVTAIDPGQRTVTIEHGGISGLRLPATRSEFPIQSAAVIRDVHTGDRVRFTLGAADETHGLLTIVSITPDGRVAGQLDSLLTSLAVALALLTLAAVVAVGVLLWRELQTLQRRVVALYHETGLLRGLLSETQDGIGGVVRGLDDAVTTLRVGYIQELRRRLAPAAASVMAEPPGNTNGSASSHALVVVQRGRGELYRAVEGNSGSPELAVIWDRRRAERRRGGRAAISPERRQSERRSSPPETWTRLGFQVVASDPTAVAPAPRLLRSAGAERSGTG
jgi:Cu/Ag efflux protein CusF